MRLLEIPVKGPLLRGPPDVVDIVGEAFTARPDWIVIPVARLVSSGATARAVGIDAPSAFAAVTA